MNLQSVLLKFASLISKFSRVTGIARRPLSRLALAIYLKAVDIELHNTLSGNGLDNQKDDGKKPRCGGCVCR